MRDSVYFLPPLFSIIYDCGQFQPMFAFKEGSSFLAMMISKGDEVASVSLQGPTMSTVVATVNIYCVSAYKA